MMVRNVIRFTATLLALAVLLSSCGLRRRKYENRINKDTQQPDKVLYDTAIDDVEHGRYERARLTLQTMMNTYDTSEYLAKAKLALADSWYREGGAHGFAQAEAEYKDFILFYPTMEEAADALALLADSYHRLGDRFEPQEAAQYTRIVKDYPLSAHADDAKAKLQKMNQPVPEADPVAYARMKYEIENRQKRGLVARAWG